MTDPVAKRTKPDRPVVVSVEWGYDLHDCPMSLQTWKRIVAGNPVRRTEPYWYEGQRFTGEWSFNSDGPGSLVVGYDDGGEGFIGTLHDAFIQVGDKDVKWQDVVSA